MIITGTIGEPYCKQYLSYCFIQPLLNVVDKQQVNEQINKQLAKNLGIDFFPEFSINSANRTELFLNYEINISDQPNYFGFHSVSVWVGNHSLLVHEFKVTGEMLLNTKQIQETALTRAFIRKHEKISVSNFN